MTSTIEYRKAVEEDVLRLSQLRIDFLYAPQERRGLEDMRSAIERAMLVGMRDGSFFAWVAMHGGEIVATSGLTVYRLLPNRSCPSGMTGRIANMYTVPEYRKQGIATKLFSLIVDEAKRGGIECLSLSATDMGKPIYERYGFVLSDDTYLYYPDHIK